MMFRRCTSTVRGLISRSRATDLLVRPIRSRSSISRSRSVSASSRTADGGSLLPVVPDVPAQVDGPCDARQQPVAAHRLFQEVGRSGAHRLHRHCDIAVAGDHDHRQHQSAIVQASLYFQPVQPRHLDVQHDACPEAGVRELEERDSGLEQGRFDIPPSRASPGTTHAPHRHRRPRISAHRSSRTLGSSKTGTEKRNPVPLRRYRHRP